VCANSLPYIEQWERIFLLGMEAALSVATEDSERAAALRQASPFAGVLTPPERTKFFRDWERNRHEA
jgi:hypothetical protein